MITTLLSLPCPGTCLYCGGERDDVIAPAGTVAATLQLGVCDVCSYALQHAWRRSRGEVAGAISPAPVNTYVLVPARAKARAEEDLSAYNFLVDAEGGLPKIPYSKVSMVAADLAREHQIAAWTDTLRPCYLGYDSRGDFSEVLLVWAWGKIPASAGQRFSSFETLLKAPGPDAGFYLGVKQAFEGLLARRESDPDNTKVCVVLREPAMRYLRYQNYGSALETGQGHEDEDEAMLELCRASMSSDELSVLALLEAADRDAAEVAGSQIRPDVAPHRRTRAAVKDDVDGVGDDDGEAVGEEEAASEEEATEAVPDGFARPSRRLVEGEP